MSEEKLMSGLRLGQRRFGVALKGQTSTVLMVTTSLVLFQQSLDTCHVPLLWKTATIVPVPKKPSPKVQNDFRPVALTSIPFKCMERLILRILLAATSFKQDPMQFAYSTNRSTEDTDTDTDTASSCVQTLGETEIVCMTAVPGLLECIQHHPTTPDVEKTDGDGCQLILHSVDLLLPN